MKYDDEPTSCVMCSVGTDADSLCRCDTDPMCVRCHRIYHVEMANRLRAWGQGGVA
jgi:hypothetical protein